MNGYDYVQTTGYTGSELFPGESFRGDLTMRGSIGLGGGSRPVSPSSSDGAPVLASGLNLDALSLNWPIALMLVGLVLVILGRNGS